MARTAIAYIDGFNFYHGVVKRSGSLKWLDYPALCDVLLRGHNVTRVNYFTARVKNRPYDPGQSQRQDDYLRALDADPRMNIVFGQFQQKKSKVDATSGQTVSLAHGGSALLAAGQWIRGKVSEEKGSDVNLGVDLSWDACSGAMDVALVLSNDLDLQRAITRAISARIEVVVVNPHHRTNHTPSLVGSATRNLKVGDLRRCQFPEEVVLADGVTRVRRPPSWL